MQRRAHANSNQAQLYELNRQVEEKRKALQLAADQEKSQILSHYRNYGIGGGDPAQKTQLQEFLKKQPPTHGIPTYMRADPSSIPLSKNISFSKPEQRTFASAGRDMLFGQPTQSTPKMTAFDQALNMQGADIGGGKFESERDRRLRLRQIERQRQKHGGISIYGDNPVQPSSPMQTSSSAGVLAPPRTQPMDPLPIPSMQVAQSFRPLPEPSGFSAPSSAPFQGQRQLPSASKKSRREELWEQKRQKRMGSLGPPETQNPVINTSATVDSFQPQVQTKSQRPPLIPPSSKNPPSPPKRPLSAIKKARMLDQEINKSEGLPNSPPSGILQFPGQRYEENRRKMHKQIANQYKVYSAARSGSADRRQSKHSLEGSGGSLPLQGFNKVSAQEKQKQQEEYRRQLEQQQQIRKQSAGPVSNRRQQMADDIFSDMMQARSRGEPAFQRAAAAPPPAPVQFRPAEAPPRIEAKAFDPSNLEHVQQRKMQLEAEINAPVSFQPANIPTSSAQYNLVMPPVQSMPGPGSNYSMPSQQREANQGGGDAWPSKITRVELPPDQQMKINKQKDQYRAFLENQMREKEEKKAKAEAERKAREEKQEREAMEMDQRLKNQRQQELGRAAVSSQQQTKFSEQVEEDFYSKPPSRRVEAQPEQANYVRFKVENMKDTVQISKREEKARKQKMWQEELKKQMEEREYQKKKQERAKKEEEERLERKLEKERIMLEKRSEYEVKLEKYKHALELKAQNVPVPEQDLIEPTLNEDLYKPTRVTQKKNLQFMTSDQIEKHRKMQASQPPAADPFEQAYSRAQDPLPKVPSKKEDLFSREEQPPAYSERSADFYNPKPVAAAAAPLEFMNPGAAPTRAQDMFAAPTSENHNIMNQGYPAPHGMSEIEKAKNEAEKELLKMQNQKLQEELLQRQREQSMRDQMFQMMMIMQANGAKMDPSQLMQQYLQVQQQMNPSWGMNPTAGMPPSMSPAQPGYPSKSYFSPPPPGAAMPPSSAPMVPSGGNLPSVPSSAKFSEGMPRVPSISGIPPAAPVMGDPGSAHGTGNFQMPSAVPFDQRPLPTQNPGGAFQVHTEFQNLPKIHHPGGTLPEPTDRSGVTLPQSNTFLPHSELPSSVESSAYPLHSQMLPEDLEKSLSSETKLLAVSTNAKLKHKAQQLARQTPQASGMVATAMLGETWVPAEQSGEKFDTFRVNMKEINEQIDKYNSKLENQKSEVPSLREDPILEEGKSATDTGAGGTGKTFNFINTGQYSPMSTDKRQTFYEQIKSLELTSSMTSAIGKQDVTVVKETDESVTDYAESSYLQANMKDIEERVQRELEAQGFKDAALKKTPTLTAIPSETKPPVEEQKSKVIRKNWSKRGIEQDGGSVNESRVTQLRQPEMPQEVEMSREFISSAQVTQYPPLTPPRPMPSDPTTTLDKLMDDIAKGYERDEQINIACTGDPVLPPEALELMRHKVIHDSKSIEEANKRFQSSARVSDGAPAWLKSDQIQEDQAAQMRPKTGMWQPGSDETSQSIVSAPPGVKVATDLRQEKPIERSGLKPPTKVSSKLNLKSSQRGSERKLSGVSQKVLEAAQQSILSSNYNLAMGESTLQQQQIAAGLPTASITTQGFQLNLDSDQESYERSEQMARTGMEKAKVKPQEVKGMRLHSLRELRDQVKRNQHRDNQIYEGLEQHVKELEEQVLSSKGFDTYKRDQKKTEIEEMRKQEDESPSLRYDQMIDKMIAQFQPPESLTKDL